MLKDASMTWRYWGEALNHAATLHNCKISSAIGNITRQQSPSEIPPNNSGLWIFGCADYVLVEKEVRKAKLDDHAQLGVYWTP